MTNILQHALDYAARSWRVLPIKRGDKRPLINGWQREATADEGKVAHWWKTWPDANVAIVMGEASGLVDIETDSPEEEADLLRLFDNDLPIAPTFRSSRGTHRLFRWQSDLPGGAVIHYRHLGIRVGNGGLGAYSLFPPSIHPSGAAYEWLPGLSPDDVTLPALSPEVVTKLWNEAGEDLPPAGNGNGKAARSPEHWEGIARGTAEGARNGNMTAFIGRAFHGCSDLSEDNIAFVWTTAQAVNARNSPPLDDRELKRTFDSILSRERMARSPAPVRTADGRPKGWHTEVVHSEPQAYELQTPYWEGVLTLTSREYLSADLLRCQALEQKCVVLPRGFRKLWEGYKDTPGLHGELMANATHRDAPPEVKRPVVVLRALHEQISQARPVEGNAGPNSYGRPTLMPDGCVAFLFDYIWQPLSKGADQIKRPELSKALDAVGRKTRDYGPRGAQRRYMVLTPHSLAKLAGLLHEVQISRDTHESLAGDQPTEYAVTGTATGEEF